MKTVISLIAALLLTLSLCSCSDNNNSNNTEPLKNNETISEEQLSPEELELKQAEDTLAAVEKEMETYETLSLREKAENYLSWDKSYWKSVDEDIYEHSNFIFSTSVEQFRYALMDQCAIVLEENGKTDMEFLKEIAHAYADCMILKENISIENYESNPYMADTYKTLIEGCKLIIEDLESLKIKINNLFSYETGKEISDIETMRELSTTLEELFFYEELQRSSHYKSKVVLWETKLND